MAGPVKARNAVMIGVVVMATIGVACSGGQPARQRERTMVSSPTTSATEALDAIVLREDAAPVGADFRTSYSGEFSGTQMIQDGSAEVRSAVLRGWVDALTREFASPETAAVIDGDASPKELDPADLLFVGSIASAYEDAVAAQGALLAIRRQLQPGMRSTETLSLGDGGAAFGDKFLGATSLTLIWTSDRFLLVVRADGMDQDEVFALAERMQSQVPA